MTNESKTENLTRKHLQKNDYYSNGTSIKVEEKKSEIHEIQNLLKRAGKAKKGGKGSPEFIVTDSENTDFAMVIECKADPLKHVSKKLNRPVDFAVDGALHYAKHLAKSFNVIAVGISGETEAQMRVSTWLHPKLENNPHELKIKNNNTNIEKIIPWKDLIEHATFNPTIQRLRQDELMEFSRELHDFMRDHAKLTESEKPLLVSGTLLALRNKPFANSFGFFDPEDLQKHWLKVITEEIGKAKLPKAKKDSMTQPYSTISVHPELGKPTIKYPKGVLHELIRQLHEKVWPFISVYKDFDVVGQFYGEFLKYTGGDKKSLGIVLTPKHITDLFARLANLNKNDKVLDICAGTGGFLISAMHHMIQDATAEDEINLIKSDGVIGIENQPNMFALAASNMILRGDGKANLYQGSSFDDSIFSEVKTRECNVGFINPPYSQKDSDLHELAFVKQMLDCLVVGGIGIAIVPLSCATSPNINKMELMKAHTLQAVMSMPIDLFHPVSAVTCVMVWEVGTPHKQSNIKTWFGYWRDDGFIKTKHKGRINQNDKWEAIRDKWVESFRNREIINGKTLSKKVDENDEWCVEAYMETDYSKITEVSFEEELRNYAVFKIKNRLV